MLLIIIILYLFNMLIKIMFIFLVKFEDIKFYIYLKFIKALVLKFFSYTNIYNN